MAPKLHPGEQVIFEGHPSWRSILGFYLRGILATAAVTLVAGIVTSFGEGGADTGLLFVIAIAGVAMTVVVGLVKRIATTYTVTTRRLHIKRGIASRTVQETRLQRVQNVNYRQGILQRLLQIGDVDFDTAAGDDYNFIFTGVAQPEGVVEQVGRATRLAGDDGLGSEQDEEREPRPEPRTR